jgi:outer membrane protein assembly factor BamB
MRSQEAGLGTVDPGRGAGIDLVTTTENDFPGYLGADRSMTVSHVSLAHDWQRRPPEEIWRRPIGSGWSGFAVVNGYGVTMEERGDQEMVTTYDLRNGELAWTYSHPGTFDHPLGGPGPRSTPLIDEGMVYALGARGLLVALDGAAGELVWSNDLLEEFDVAPEQELANVFYGRSNSPLVVGDLLVIPGGGNRSRPPASLVAYHKRTGEKIWEGGERQISFSSPRLATLAGVEQILIVNEDTASGHHPATGAVLWEHPWPGRTPANASASQAVPVAPDRVLLSKGYGEGSALIQLVPREDGTFQVRTVWHNQRVLRTKLTNVALLDGHAYGLSQGILECVDVETGERVWKRGRYGHGQMLLVDRTLLILTEDGELVHVEATPDRPNFVLGRLQALTGQTWNNFALYGEYLVLRNAREAVVYRLPLED